MILLNGNILVEHYQVNGQEVDDKLSIFKQETSNTIKPGENYIPMVVVEPPFYTDEMLQDEFYPCVCVDDVIIVDATQINNFKVNGETYQFVKENFVVAVYENLEDDEDDEEVFYPN